MSRDSDIQWEIDQESARAAEQEEAEAAEVYCPKCGARGEELFSAIKRGMYVCSNRFCLHMLTPFTFEASGFTPKALCPVYLPSKPGLNPRTLLLAVSLGLLSWAAILAAFIKWR